jgi:hypothetical protein
MPNIDLVIRSGVVVSEDGGQGVQSIGIIGETTSHIGGDLEDWEVKGWSEMTIRRGEIVFQDGKILGKPGTGKYLRRGAVPNLYRWEALTERKTR